MPSDHSRTWSSGTAAGAAAPAQTLPGTGTPPGAWRGAGADQRFGQTERKDNWWLMPVAQAIGLSILGAYATWAAFQGNHYEIGNYLSPFYSPTIKPSWWPFSPALMILWIPLGFRTTCYYYRKAYYRAFFLDPIACAVGEANPKRYLGENKFPFVLQNMHRYFMYLAAIFLIFLWWDVIRAFTFDGRLGVGVGSLAILASTASLSAFTFSCNSLRHLLGGRVDCFSCAVAGGPRHNVWSGVSLLNEHHMAWAWWSLLAVCFADFYVRMCSMGIFRDARIF
jgi:hypothetical protein